MGEICERDGERGWEIFGRESGGLGELREMRKKGEKRERDMIYLGEREL